MAMASNPTAMGRPSTAPAIVTATDRVANLDINGYSERMYGCAFSELTALQRTEVAASMRADQRAATGGAVPEDSEAATATRLADRAARASDREAVRDRDDYAMATYGCPFASLTPAQMEDVANYMRDDEKRVYGTVIAGGEAANAKRQADAAYAAAPAGEAWEVIGAADVPVTTTGAPVAADVTAFGPVPGATVPSPAMAAAPACPPGSVPVTDTTGVYQQHIRWP